MWGTCTFLLAGLQLSRPRRERGRVLAGPRFQLVKAKA